MSEKAYRNSFQCVSLHGPTLFAPLIHAASQVATACAVDTKAYVVLLILTDGVIMDMQQTVDAIVAATHLPLSIVIVGVGTADFSVGRPRLVIGHDHVSIIWQIGYEYIGWRRSSSSSIKRSMCNP